MAKQVEKDYRDGGESRAQIGLEVHQRNLAEIILGTYRKSYFSSRNYLSDFFGKFHSLKTEKKDLFTFWNNPDVGDDEGTLAFLELFRTTAFNAAKEINGTTKETLRRAVDKLVVQGAGEVQIAAVIAKNVSKEVLEKNRFRPRTIARTETGSALMESQYKLIGDMELPPMQKVWATSVDQRTRDSHRKINGDTVKKDEYFTVGRERMLYPQDRKNGSKKENINCRCVLTWEPVEDGVESDIET